MKVYFLIAEEHDIIKIGTTTGFRQRYKELANKHRLFNTYMIAIKNSPIDEKDLLEMFHPWSKKGEYFYGNRRLYEYIQMLYDTCDSLIISPGVNDMVSRTKKNVIRTTITRDINELQKQLYLYNNSIY